MDDGIKKDPTVFGDQDDVEGPARWDQICFTLSLFNYNKICEPPPPHPRIYLLLKVITVFAHQWKGWSVAEVQWFVFVYITLVILIINWWLFVLVCNSAASSETLFLYITDFTAWRETEATKPSSQVRTSLWAQIQSLMFSGWKFMCLFLFFFQTDLEQDSTQLLCYHDAELQRGNYCVSEQNVNIKKTLKQQEFITYCYFI